MRWLAWVTLCAVAGCTALVVLGGCSAQPQNHYYLLSATRGSGASAGAVPSAPGPRLVHVRLPGVLDRLQFVEGRGDHSVAILEFDRWAEPLDQMVLRVLSEDLAADMALRPSSQAARLEVNVGEFMASQSGVARLTGTWSENPQGGGAPPGPTWRFAFSAPVDASRSADVAASLSALLGQLADQIADHVAGTGGA